MQHGETAIHLVAKYNHASVVAAFASFKVNVNIVGKVMSSSSNAIHYPINLKLFVMFLS